MNKGSTDFNDQAVLHGKDNLAQQLERDLVAMTSAKQTGRQPVQVDEEPPPPDEVPPNVSDNDYDDIWFSFFEKNQYGQKKATVRNIELVLNNDPEWRGVLGYCEFSYSIIKRLKPPLMSSDVGEWNDADAAALRVWVSYKYGFTPSHADIADALSVVSRKRPFHPVCEYLNQLKWDGLHRLSTWLNQAFESTDNEKYLNIVGPKVLVGAVARVMQPGCKMDNVMILEGEQGKGKSTTIRRLFGEWFTDAPLPIGDKDAYMVIQGKWGLEIAELDAFHKAEVTALKHFFSQQIDRFRPAYGRVAQDHPRQTVFWASTNQDVYLRDYTGNRRFWPLYCTVVNAQWVKNNRDQLWAEAVHLYNQGYRWWVSRDTKENELEWAVVTEVQDSRLQRDPWEDKLAPWLDSKVKPYLTTTEILEDCIGLDSGHIQQAHMNRLGPIMRSLGWRNVRERVPGKGGKIRQIRVWKYEDTEKEFDEVPL
jgi:putative DNA primase/helicase